MAQALPEPATATTDADEAVLPPAVVLSLAAPFLLWLLGMAAMVALAPAFGLFDPDGGLGRYGAIKELGAASFGVAVIAGAVGIVLVEQRRRRRLRKR